MPGNALRWRMLLSGNSEAEQLCTRRGGFEARHSAQQQLSGPGPQPHGEDAGLGAACLACRVCSATGVLYTSLRSWFSKAFWLLLSSESRHEGLPILISQPCSDPDLICPENAQTTSPGTQLWIVARTTIPIPWYSFLGFKLLFFYHLTFQSSLKAISWHTCTVGYLFCWLDVSTFYSFVVICSHHRWEIIPSYVE